MVGNMAYDVGGENFFGEGRVRVGMQWQEIQLEEVMCALKKLMNNKAAGIDGIPYECYKYGGVIVGCHTDLFKQIWREGKAPNDWADGWVTLIHKEETKRE